MYTAGLQPKSPKSYWDTVRRKSAGVVAEGGSLTVVVVCPKNGYAVIQNPHLLTAKVARESMNFKEFTYSKFPRLNVPVTTC